MTMTAVQIEEQTGTSISKIRGKYYRMYGGGFNKNAELPDDIVQYYIKPNEANSEPNRTKETKRTELKVVNRTEPSEPEPDVVNEQRTANRTEHPEPNHEPLEQTEPEPNNKQFDPGEYLFFHPAAQFVYVCVLLGCGAYVFGQLAAKVFPDGLNAFTQWMYYGAGFLVEASGIMIAKSYKRKDKFDDANQVWVFLVVLFLLELWVEFSYMFADNPFSLGGLAVVILRPFGQLVYSGLYLNKNK